MKIYKQEDIQKIKSELFTVKKRYADLVVQKFELSANLKEEKAKEYLHYGVGRRLEFIERCVENIFSVFPIDRSNLLCREELMDVAINLHAFYVNIFGFLDNLAWVLIHEKRPGGAINKMNVGLFKEEIKQYLTDEFCQYLHSSQMRTWHDQYLKNYRDALSHRIPLYVPPQILNAEQKKELAQMDQEIINCYKTHDFSALAKLRKQQMNIGTICPIVHDSCENRGVLLHPQVLTDFNTIEEIVKKYCESFLRKS